MSDEYLTVGALLEDLTGHGVYDVAIVEDQLPRFGFIYDRQLDMLEFENRKVRLGSKTRKQMQKEMDSDPKGGILDLGLPDETRVVDALALSEAIFRLVVPGRTPPSTMYNGRGKGFRKNVEAIRAVEEATKNPFGIN